MQPDQSSRAVHNGSGTLLRRYVHGSGVDEPLIWYEGSSLTTRRILRADRQGSIVSVADSAGASVAINSYDEYGIPASGNLGRFQYTGQIMLPDLNFYHYKARIYSPTLGRFLQTDPVGYDDQINLYAYVNNDPINGRDPTGKESVSTKISMSTQDRCPKGKTNCSQGDVQSEGPVDEEIIVPAPPQQEPKVESNWLDKIQVVGKVGLSGPCNVFQRGGQRMGAAMSDVGSTVSKLGLGVTAAGGALAAAGVVTGNPPLAGVGVLTMGKGAEMTATGGLISGGGAIVSALSGSGKDGAVDLTTRALVGKMPEGAVKDFVSEAISATLNSFVPDVVSCQ